MLEDEARTSTVVRHIGDACTPCRSNRAERRGFAVHLNHPAPAPSDTEPIKRGKQFRTARSHQAGQTNDLPFMH